MNPRTRAPWKFSHVIEHTSEGDKIILSIQDYFGTTIALFPMYNTLDNPVTNLMVRAPKLRDEVEKLNAEVEKLNAEVEKLNAEVEKLNAEVEN